MIRQKIIEQKVKIVASCAAGRLLALKGSPALLPVIATPPTTSSSTAGSAFLPPLSLFLITLTPESLNAESLNGPPLAGRLNPEPRSGFFSSLRPERSEGPVSARFARNRFLRSPQTRQFAPRLFRHKLPRAQSARPVAQVTPHLIISHRMRR